MGGTGYLYRMVSCFVAIKITSSNQRLVRKIRYKSKDIHKNKNNTQNKHMNSRKEQIIFDITKSQRFYRER